MITGRGTEGFAGQLGLEAGKFDTRKLSGSVSGGSDVGDFYLSATDFDTDGFNAQTADAVNPDDDGADNRTLHAKLGWNATENLRLQLVARDIDASTRYDGCFDSVTSLTVRDCLGTTDQMTYKLSADLRSGKAANSFGYSNVGRSRSTATRSSCTPLPATSLRGRSISIPRRRRSTSTFCCRRASCGKPSMPSTVTYFA